MPHQYRHDPTKKNPIGFVPPDVSTSEENPDYESPRYVAIHLDRGSIRGYLLNEDDYSFYMSHDSRGEDIFRIEKGNNSCVVTEVNDPREAFENLFGDSLDTKIDGFSNHKV